MTETAEKSKSPQLTRCYFLIRKHELCMIYRGRFCANVARLLIAIACVISSIIYHNVTRMTARCRAYVAMSNLRRGTRRSLRFSVIRAI